MKSFSARSQARSQQRLPLEPPAPPPTFAESIKACAGTVNPFVLAQKAARMRAAIALDEDPRRSGRFARKAAIPGVIAGLRFTHLTFVITGDEEDGAAGKAFRPVNENARVVWRSAEKARAIKGAAPPPRTIAEFCTGFTRNPAAYSATTAKARLLVEDGDTVLCAIKADTVDDARRECVGILSTTDLDSQNERIDDAALRAATIDLAARVGSKAYVTDVNHRREIDDVTLAAVWPGTGGIGADGSTYCLWQFPKGSKTWEAVKAGRCAGFSFAAPIVYAR